MGCAKGYLLLKVESGLADPAGGMPGMLLPGPGPAAMLELFNMPGAGAMLWPGTMLELGGMPGTGGWGRGFTLFVGPGPN